jgi:hypothetical protein
MSGTGVLHYAAGQASQEMACEPRLSIQTQVGYLLESNAIQDANELLAEAGGIEKLTDGQQAWFELEFGQDWRGKFDTND